MNSGKASELAQSLVGCEIDGWRVLGQISYGNTAIVLRASKDGEVGALKIFDPDLRGEVSVEVQLARINRQLSLKGKTHPHLVEILDGGLCQETGNLFVVMRLVEGSNLRDLLGQVPRDRIASIISQVASAAQFLETIGIVHRDIKPSNISLSLDFQQAVLLDLGVIRPVGPSDLTDNSGHRPFVGTMRYSPPEFLYREEKDSLDGWRALTFYQLGAVLHDLVMQRRIFDEYSHSSAQLMDAIKRVSPDLSSSDAPPYLTSLARNCLVKDPGLRVQLVSWADFYIRHASDDRVESIKQRIRSREIIAAQEGRTALVMDGGNSVAAITEGIVERIRSECVKSGLFPPVEINSYAESVLRSIIHVSFPSSQRFSLVSPTSLVILVESIDAAELALKVRWAAFLGEVKLRDVLSANETWKVLYSGVFDLEILSQRLGELLYRVLDTAQEVSVALESEAQLLCEVVQLVIAL